MASKEVNADLAEHEKTFHIFLRLVWWSIGIIAVALILLFAVFVGNPYA